MWIVNTTRFYYKESSQNDLESGWVWSGKSPGNRLWSDWFLNMRSLVVVWGVSLMGFAKSFLPVSLTCPRLPKDLTCPTPRTDDKKQPPPWICAGKGFFRTHPKLVSGSFMIVAWYLTKDSGITILTVLKELQNPQIVALWSLLGPRDVDFAKCWMLDVRSLPSSQSKVICLLWRRGQLNRWDGKEILPSDNTETRELRW